MVVELQTGVAPGIRQTPGIGDASDIVITRKGSTFINYQNKIGHGMQMKMSSPVGMHMALVSSPLSVLAARAGPASIAEIASAARVFFNMVFIRIPCVYDGSEKGYSWIIPTATLPQSIDYFQNICIALIMLD